MKRKKVLITTGIVIGILVIAVIVLVFIRRKNDDFKCPVTGVKLGMDYKEVERILEKKGVKWIDWEGEPKSLSIKNVYSDFFETETNTSIDFSETNKLYEMQYSAVYNTIEECEKVWEKLIKYYTKKYGKPKVKEDHFIFYSWEKDDWGICIFHAADSEELIMMIGVIDK